jgi:hypothetical protein
MNARGTILTIVLASVAAAWPPAPASGASHVRTHVIASGGNPGASAGRTLHGTAGQGAIGVSGNGIVTLRSGYWSAGGLAVVDVTPDPTPVPRALAFGAPAPNPARGLSTFELSLPRAARVEVAVFDLGGRRVRTLAAAALDAGDHAVRWDGRAEDGAPAPTGLYFARAVVDGRALAERRVVRLH